MAPVPGEYVVSWRGYHSRKARDQLLANALAGLGGWREMPRDNDADRLLPSDFSVVAVEGKAAQSAVVAALRAKKDVVRSVTPHLTIRGEGSLKSANPPSGAGGDGPAHVPSSFPVASKLGAPSLWTLGVTGARVKVAIFDTGLGRGALYLNNVAERRDWTSDKSVEDGVGHGTFVAGMVAGTNPTCMGMAPDSELYFFKVFTNRRVSFTAWFLDAFNYAIHTKMDVLNLSIGGPDFMDKPFTEKVAEVTSSGVVMVSAIGNDGPVFGTLNNPADMSSVIGVGGLGRQENNLALFSSRGMTTWELPEGYGRVKPDVATLSTQLLGPDRSGGCMEQSGTSMASPVIAGAVALIISSVPMEQRAAVVNPGSIKQVLLESAVRLVRGGGVSVFEQGAGRLNLAGAVSLMKTYVPRLSFHPPYWDATECPYFSPYCDQPIYHSSMPVIFNATLINGISVTGKLEGAPVWQATNSGGQHLRMAFEWSYFMWPWSGFVAVRITVAESGKAFQGIAEGVISVKVITPHRAEADTVQMPVRLRVIPTPPRKRRLLWDQYHNARYPPGYFPRDDLLFTATPFDWNADHIHTNFLPLFRVIRKLGYFVEVLGEPWTCFAATNYAALLVVDPEEELWEQEQRKLEGDITEHGLSLLVLADWYNVDLMKKLRFQDQNTQQQWTPVTGGSHLPALNEFLEAFGVAFTTRVVHGLVSVNGRTFDYASGSTIGAFPKGAHLMTVNGLIDQRMEMVDGQSSAESEPHAIGGWFELPQPAGGRMVVFGDSSFLDGAGRTASREDKNAHRGYWAVEDILGFLTFELRADQVLPLAARVLTETMAIMTEATTPRRFHMTSILRVSRVLHRKQSGEAPICTDVAYGASSSVGRYDWEAAHTKRLAAQAEPRNPRPVDMMLVARILGRKAPGRISQITAYVSVPWALFCVGLLLLPALLWYNSRAQRQQQEKQMSRERLFSSGE